MRAILFTLLLLFVLTAPTSRPVSIGVLPMTTEANRWTRYGSNPLFGGADGAAVAEPSVLVDGATLKMWYRAGWATGQLNYATSNDGLTWSQYGSNPVLGQGGSGYAGDVFEPFIVLIGATYHCYFTDAAGGNLKHSTSSDGLTWVTPTQIIASNAYAWEQSWGNPYVWKEGATWYGLFEYRVPVDSMWQTSLFTSSDGLSWTLDTQPISSLQPVANGDVGGPFMMQPTPTFDGIYYLWYHGNVTGLTLPTDLYRATSPDLVTWTKLNSSTPLLTHSGSAPEEDQVSDPTLVEFNGQSFLYFIAVNNATNTAKIEVLTYAGTIRQVIGLGTPLYHIGRSGLRIAL
jgi:hypothetical protein